MSLNPFPVTDLRPEVELVHLLRIRMHYRHKGCRKCRARNDRVFVGDDISERDVT